MGTSQSSNGSPSGVPMVPPWVPDIPSPAVPPNGATSEETSNNHKNQDAPPHIVSPQPKPVPIAPVARFGSTRLSLGLYASSGDRTSMYRGVGRYIRVGYGGGMTATRRFGGTVQTAGILYSALSGDRARSNATPRSQLNPLLLAGRSTDEVMDAVIEAVRPIDGTQDTEASRASIKEALSNVLTRFPDADLMNLGEQQLEFAIENYVAADVFHRFDLDVGKTIRAKAQSAVTGLGRLKEVREYIRETVAESFRKLRDLGQRLAAGRITQIVQTALRETFEVFEGYAR